MASDVASRSWTRRRVLRALVGAAGAGVAGRILTACGPTAVQLTSAASSPVVLVWRPWADFPAGDLDTAYRLMYDGLAPFLATHPHVEVRITGGARGAVLASALLGGAQVDVLNDAALPLYVQQGLLLDLQPYTRRDGVDLGIYPRAVLDYFLAVGATLPGGGLYCLPALTRTEAMAVNLQALDDLGLAYPEPGWTYLQWTALWQAATNRAPDRRSYGCLLDWSGYDTTGGNPAPFYLRGFGGEYVDPADATRCALADPPTVQALQWCYGLVQQGVAGGKMPDDFTAGRLVSGPVSTAGDLAVAAARWQALKWDLYPMPVWPTGPLTGVAPEFYAIWAGTRAPDVAWELLRFLCVETGWQEFVLGLALVGPNQKALWDQWRERVISFAPPLSKVNLQAFIDPILRDQLYVGRSFRFDETRSAQALLAFGQAARAGTQDLAALARQYAEAINQIQAAGLARLQAAEAALHQLQQAAAAAGPGLSPGGSAAAPAGRMAGTG
jgi:ABC-type glycerol-3-phosphate transport system substrate-binding protein